MNIAGFVPNEGKEAVNIVDKAKISDNIPVLTNATISTNGVSPVHSIGHIDKSKYQNVSNNITTDEVIITNERIDHIKERHPNDFERYSKYLTEIVENPQYILEANKPNTAFILKEFVEDGEQFELILRLAVEGDTEGYKNSIITFLEVSKKRFNRYLRTKKILYKADDI